MGLLYVAAVGSNFLSGREVGREGSPRSAYLIRLHVSVYWYCRLFLLNPFDPQWRCGSVAFRRTWQRVSPDVGIVSKLSDSVNP